MKRPRSVAGPQGEDAEEVVLGDDDLPPPKIDPPKTERCHKVTIEWVTDLEGLTHLKEVIERMRELGTVDEKIEPCMRRPRE